MKVFKSSRLAAMAGAAFLALAGTVYADPEGPFLNSDIGVSFLQNFPSGFTTDPGVRFSLAPGYRIYYDDAMEVSLQLETGLIWNSYRWHSGFNSAQGDMYQVPVMAGFEYAFHVAKIVVPYIGVAGGGVFNDREVSGHGLFGSATGSATSFDGGVQGMAGVRFRITEHADLGVGYKFLATFPSGIDYLGTHSVSLTFVWHF
jgi:hypothetical protein